MSTFRIIAGREMKLALRNRSVIITALIFAVWFPVMSGVGIASGAGGDATVIAGGIARQCLKRSLTAGEMVGPCLFLASEASAAITAPSVRTLTTVETVTTNVSRASRRSLRVILAMMSPPASLPGTI